MVGFISHWHLEAIVRTHRQTNFWGGQWDVLPSRQAERGRWADRSRKQKLRQGIGSRDRMAGSRYSNSFMGPSSTIGVS